MITNNVISKFKNLYYTIGCNNILMFDNYSFYKSVAYLLQLTISLTNDYRYSGHNLLLT